MISRAFPSLFLLLMLSSANRVVGDEVRVLLPVAAFTPVAGANGSVWTTDIVARNIGTRVVQLLFSDCGTVLCPEPYATIAPNSTIHLLRNSPAGATVLMSSAEAVNVVFSARVRDLSRQSETWGTEIPVVDVAELSSSAAHLLNIPSGAEFRVTLRIYDFSGFDPRSFRVRVFPLEGDTPMNETVVSTLHVPGEAMTQATVTDLLSRGETGAVRFEITALSEGTRFWAFASVTNNVTQHVTVVTQRP